MDKLHYTTKRNYLNSAIVFLMAIKHKEEKIEEYNEIRNKYNTQYIEENESGKISEKQKDNFVDIQDIKDMIDEMWKDLSGKKIKKQTEINAKDKALLQVYIIYNILIKIPLRNDLAGMEAISKTQYNKLSDEDKKSINYLVVEKNKMFFVLNEYKTSAKYKQKNIDIPKDLEKLLRMYLKIDGMGLLFKSSTGKALSRNALSQLLLKTSKKYMDKNISTTMIRKIVLSDLFAVNKKKQAEMSEITGHSVDTMNDIYIKEK